MAQAANVTLTWNPNPESDIAGYRVYAGTGSGNYTTILNVGKNTTTTVSNLTAGTLYYFAVSAYNNSTLESPRSSEVSATVGTPPPPTPSNTPPVISNIPDQTIGQDKTLGPISFTVSDAETTTTSLMLSGASSNVTLLPTGNITFGTSGSSRTLTLRPAAGQTGTSTITVTVSDGTLTAKDTLLLSVTAPANLPPTITNLPDQNTGIGTTVGPINFTIGDSTTPAANLTLSGTSSNLTLVPNGNILFGGSGANRTVSVTPTSGQSGSSTIAIRVSDGSLTATDSFQLSIAAPNPSPGATSNLWASSVVPGRVDAGPDSAVELGVRFRSDVAGSITGIRFYKAAANTGTHVGNLWTNSGTRLATATFTGESASGWQEVQFATPVAITANTVYVASYHTNTGHYSADAGFFSARGVDKTPLHAPASSSTAPNGVYAYGSNSAFPTQTWQTSNYWVDVVFKANSAVPSPATISTTSLPSQPINGAYSATLTASGGATPYTWSVASGALPPGLTLNPTSGTITGTPTTAGSFGFSARLSDASTPAQTVTKALNITITPVAAKPLSLWPPSAVPGMADAGPDNAVEVGVRFRSDLAGYITGIRFYKASTNTGTHVGNLWTSTGTRLASATFSGESASGWQEVKFTTPVAITANTDYVASYHTNTGHYSADLGFFSARGVDNPPLHAPVSSSTARNGVYAYGSNSTFPTQVWNTTNYWVDILFQVTP